VRYEPPARGWALVFAKAMPIALAAGALMALGLLMSLIHRR
jgi:hypothetical protein